MVAELLLRRQCGIDGGIKVLTSLVDLGEQQEVIANVRVAWNAHLSVGLHCFMSCGMGLFGITGGKVTLS